MKLQFLLKLMVPLLFYASCSNPQTFAGQNGRIDAEQVTSVLYFKKNQPLLRGQEQQAVEIRGPEAIAEIVNMINSANTPAIVKTGRMDELWLMTTDSVIKLECNSEWIGTSGSNTFYKIDNEVFERNFGG